jgi:hypothetical protein
VWQNTTENPDNHVYYSNGLSGLANMSAAVASIPFFMSKPHFLDGDAALVAAVTGLTPPVRDAHDTYFDVEPITGAVLGGPLDHAHSPVS